MTYMVDAVAPSETNRAEVPLSAAYISARDAIRNLGQQSTNPKLNALLSWFPSEQEQRSLEEFGTRLQAKFTADALGRVVDWDDRTQLLYVLKREKDKYGGGLGLSQEDTSKLYPFINRTTHAVEGYTDDLIDRVLKRDLSAVASHVTTAGEALGLHTKLLPRSHDQARMRITFADGSPQIKDHVDAVLYLSDDAPRDTAVEAASYDPKTYEYNLRLKTRA